MRALNLMPLLAGSVLLAAAGSALPQPAAEEETVVIWRRVRNDFHDPHIPAAALDELVRKSPPLAVRLKPGETLSGHLQRTLNISQTWTPRMYESLVARIATLNGLQDVDQVPAGTRLQIPAVPATGKKYFATPPSAGQNVKLLMNMAAGVVSSATTQKSAPAQVSPQFELQYIAVPASQVARYALGDHPEQGASGRIRIDLAQAPDTGEPSRVLGEEAAVQIRSSLAGAAAGKPQPVVLVVDDSLPDDAEYVRTAKFVVEVSQKLRSVFHLGESPYLAAVQNLPSKLPAADPSMLYPNLRTHASIIKHALREFQALDPQRRVEVVYLPLAATQTGVAPLLKELVYLSELLKVVRPELPVKVTAGLSQREHARTMTETYVANNRTVFESSPLPLVGSGNLSIHTDRILLEAMSIVLSYYSDATRRPHAFSFSWTTPNLALPAYFPPAVLGWKFAAAGNHLDTQADRDFVRRELQFAARAVAPRDVVAVVNSSGTSAACASNVFSDSELKVMSLSFPGHVTTSLCGTSFATPRVAWLFAAREAVRGSIPQPPMDAARKAAWLDRQQDLVFGFRKPAIQDPLARYILDPKALFTP